MVDKLESNQAPLFNSFLKGVMVNVGWMSLKKFKTDGLKDFKLPDMSKITLINNGTGI